MQITPPAEAQAIIEREILSGRYTSVIDVIVDALKHLDDEPYVYDAMSDPKVLEAIAQADRGEVYEWNDELRADIRRQAREDARLGKRIPDDVKY